MEQLTFLFDQRWQERREVRRYASQGKINPAEFGVEVLDGEREARAFIEAHHYSGSFPAAHVSVGLFRKTGVAASRLVGVAVFSEGIQSGRSLPKWTGFSAQEGTELGRLVVLPEVAHNGESWFIRRAFRALQQERPQTRAVVSYSDPLERTTAAGEVVKPGHYGTIYQASNALYVGRAEGRTLLLLPDGRVLQGYTFNKFLTRKKGWGGAERQIIAAGVAAGIAPRQPGEEEAAWCARVKAGLRPLKHPGNFTYAFGLDSDAWDTIRTLHGGKGQPYPKARDFQAAA